MSLYGALFSGVSGLKSQANRLGIVSDNIANVNTVGYKQASALFQSLVTPNASATQYSPGGVIGGNRQLVDRQGLLQSTDTPTDIAISGKGFFVVSGNNDGSGTTFYTRAGSFRQDNLGNFVNASGFFLKAWPLDSQGRLPGAAGNLEHTTSSADLSSLQVVNVRSTSGTAAATSNVDLSLNLNAGETIFPGSSQTVTMDALSTNNASNAADDIIIGDDYGAASINHIRKGDYFNIVTVDADGAQSPHQFKLGGYTIGRSVTDSDVTLANNSLATTSGDATVIVTSVGHGLGRVGDTRYVTIDGIGAMAGFASVASVEGTRQITVIDADHYSFQASTTASATSAGTGGSTVVVDKSPGENASTPLLHLGSNAFAVTATSNVVTVTATSHGLGPVGSTRRVVIDDVANATTYFTAASDVEGSRLITITGANTFTFNADTAASGTSAGFGGDSSTVDDFTGNILDASSASTAFLAVSGTSLFVDAALSFTITVDGTTHTFTYKSSSPSASAGQFNNMTNLAGAIDNTSDLTARVVNGRLYVGAENANLAVTFANGDGDGDSALALGGIDWVKELGLNAIGPDTSGETFSSLDGLSEIVNNFDDISASISSATSDSALEINVNDPRGTIQFSDENSLGNSTNHGSLLSELGLIPSLNSTAYTAPGTLSPTGPEYDASGGTGDNMASGAITPQFSRNVRIYDSLGTGHDVTVAYLKIGINRWAVEVYLANESEISQSSGLVDGQIAAGTMTFNGDGSLNSVDSSLGTEDSPASITWTNQAQPSTIAFNWGSPGALGEGKTDGLSQFDADYSLNFISQNGSPVGELTAVSIDEDGFISASFTNGEVQKLYKIPIADFNNPNGLQGVTGNVFAQSNTSGEFNLREAGQNGVGDVSPSSLESSNVELSEQLTDMIIAQRAYQANTRIITTTDKLLEELNNITR